jgi:PleD family two-component response regulator
VDDHLGARITIRELLDWHSFQVCGDAKDGKEAIEKVVELRPDIILLDINMPVMNGIKAAQEIRRISPATNDELEINNTHTGALGWYAELDGPESHASNRILVLPAFESGGARICRVERPHEGGGNRTKPHLA